MRSTTRNERNNAKNITKGNHGETKLYIDTCTNRRALFARTRFSRLDERSCSRDATRHADVHTRTYIEEHYAKRQRDRDRENEEQYQEIAWRRGKTDELPKQYTIITWVAIRTYFVLIMFTT